MFDQVPIAVERLEECLETAASAPRRGYGSANAIT